MSKKNKISYAGIQINDFLNIAVRNQIIGCFWVFPLSYLCGRVSVTSSRTSPIKSDHWIT